MEDKMAKRPRVRRPKKKVCAFCAEKATSIDYKDANKLRKYITERGKIAPRRGTGCCASIRESLPVAIKRARVMALLPYVVD